LTQLIIFFSYQFRSFVQPRQLTSRAAEKVGAADSKSDLAVTALNDCFSSWLLQLVPLLLMLKYEACQLISIHGEKNYRACQF